MRRCRAGTPGPHQAWSAMDAGNRGAAAVLVAAWSSGSRRRTVSSRMPTDSMADMEILLGEDSMEMLEDLEFYSWIYRMTMARTSKGDVGLTTHGRWSLGCCFASRSGARRETSRNSKLEFLEVPGHVGGVGRGLADAAGHADGIDK